MISMISITVAFMEEGVGFEVDCQYIYKNIYSNIYNKPFLKSLAESHWIPVAIKFITSTQIADDYIYHACLGK